MKLVYVTGAGHSGSSLFDFLLGSCPDIVSTGESHRLSHNPETRLCSCGDVVADCVYWSAVAATTHVERWQDWPMGVLPSTMRTRVSWRVATAFVAVGRFPISRLQYWSDHQQAIRRSWKVYESLVAISGAEAVVDSTKTPMRLVGFGEAFPDQTFAVHLVRDPRAVAASEVRRTGNSWTTAARNWGAAQRKTRMALRHVRRSHQLCVRYEDLCADPLREINRVRELLGLTGIAQVPTLVHPVHMIPGNPVLLKGIHEIRLDERWKNQASKSNQSVVLDVVGKIASEFGYGDE